MRTLNLSDLPEITLLRSTRPLARKEHNCSVCALPIAIGTRYGCHVIIDRSTTLADLRVRTIKWHEPRCPVVEERR